MGKKEKKFHEFKKPRYLPGTVENNILKNDLEAYNQHRYKVFSAKCKIDNLAPLLNPFHFLNSRRLHMDALRLQQVDKENKILLKKINIINRLGGIVQTYNPVAYETHSKWAAHDREMRKICYGNQELYRLIKLAQSQYSVKIMSAMWKSTLEKIHITSRLPIVIFDKPDLDKQLKSQPSISGHLALGPAGDRPLCFVEFQVKGGERLGKVTIELYHDHTPVTVQNFLEICSGKDLTYKNCLVHRIVRGKFLATGDITHGTGRGGCSIYGKTFDEENHMLRHTRAGILSMTRVGENQNNSQFCISFCKLEELDRKNVVFGKIVCGIQVIYKIEQYGRKIGKPIADIIISNCGQIDGNNSKLAPKNRRKNCGGRRISKLVPQIANV